MPNYTGYKSKFPKTPAPPPPAHQTKPGEGTHTTASPAAPVPAAAAVGAAALPPASRDAYEFLLNIFNGYGLGSLAPAILGFVQQGYGSDTISILLQQTPEYAQRFSGNQVRLKAGLPVLSPAEYLSTESAYRSVMQAAGLPSGFYDDPSDFSGWIGEGKSPDEINSRVQGYLKVAKNTDPAYRSMLSDEFGINLSDGDIAAFMLDDKRALPLIQKQVEAIGISDAARRQGLGSSAARSLSLAEQGVTGDQAQQAFGQISQLTHDYGAAAAATGLAYGQDDAENEALLGLDSARRKRQQVENSFGAINTKQSSKTANTSSTGSSY